MQTRMHALWTATLSLVMATSGCEKEPPPRVFNHPLNTPFVPKQAKREFNVSVPPTVDGLLDEIDKTFMHEGLPIGPRVLVFPPIDEEGRVLEDGFAVSHVANVMIGYQRDKRFALPVWFVRNRLFVEARCAADGRPLDETTIKACQSALETRLIVVPRVQHVQDSDKHDRIKLSVEFHGDGEQYADQTFEHELHGQSAIEKMPGLIAVDVLKHLRETISDDESHGLVNDNHQVINLNRYYHYPMMVAAAGGRFRQNLNEPCWVELCLTGCSGGEMAKELFLQAQPDRRYSLLEIGVARAMYDRPEEAIMLLLPLAARHRQDVDYWIALLLRGKQVSDSRVFQRLLEQWRKVDSGYLAHLMRGEILIEAAWQARGDGYADTVTPEGARLFAERLASAREELEAAVEANPNGCWQAECALVRVGMGLGLPREYVEEHFTSAIQLYPEYQAAWSAMYNDLLPQWHGSAEELISLGVRAVRSGQWKADVASLMRNAVRELAADPLTGQLRKEACQTRLIIEAILAFHEAAEKSGREEDKGVARGLLLKTAVLGEQFDAVADAVQTMPGDFESPDFMQPSEMRYYRSLILAKVGHGMEGTLAQSRIALADSRIEEAAKLLDGVRSDDEQQQAEINRLVRAVTIARRLAAEGSVRLSASEIKETFDCTAADWEIKGGALVASSERSSTKSLTCPFGMRNCRISMTLVWATLTDRVDVVLHSPSILQQVVVSYYPLKRAALLVGLAGKQEHIGLPLGEAQKFVVECRPGSDRIMPCPGVEWMSHTDAPVLSGFVIRLFNELQRPQWAGVEDLYIELLLDDPVPSDENVDAENRVDDADLPQDST